MLDLRRKRILVTGGAGFLGSHLIEKLKERGAQDIFIPHSSEFDLRLQENCRRVVQGKDLVIHLAAKVGGIGYNREKSGELFYDNMAMGLHLIEEARLAGVRKFVAIGTVCAYPKFTPVPFQEENLWAGYPEETNAPYGLAKKMMLVQAQAYRAQYGFNAIYLLPVNLYGPGDNFNPESSHVIPALIRKVVEAKLNEIPFVTVWGTGQATREFLYVEDAAEAIVLATEKYDGSQPVNIGSGQEIGIRDLVGLICKLVNYTGEIRWDISKPDGQPKRSLDVTKAWREFGFKAKTSFQEGLEKTISWYIGALRRQEKVPVVSVS